VAVIVEAPGDTPTTGTDADVAPGVTEIDDGTVAAAGLLEVRLTVNPAGTGEDRPRVRVPGEHVFTARFGGERVIVIGAFTCTVAVPDTYPGALAVIDTTPGLTPVTCGGVAGVVAPAGMVTLDVTVAIDVLLLVRLTVTGAGAADGRVTTSATD
jgi:hypothetical protein